MIKKILISILQNGFGFGITPEKEKVFFHSSNFGMKSFSELKVGDSFLSILENGQKGLTAIPIMSCEVVCTPYQLGVKVCYLTKENSKRRDSFLNYAIHGEKLDDLISEEVRVGFFSSIAERAKLGKESMDRRKQLLEEFNLRVEKVGIKPDKFLTGGTAEWHTAGEATAVTCYNYRWFEEIKEELKDVDFHYSSYGFLERFHFFSYTREEKTVEINTIEIASDNKITETNRTVLNTEYKISEMVEIPYVYSKHEEKVDYCSFSFTEFVDESEDGYRSGGSIKRTYTGPGIKVTELYTAPNTFEYKGTTLVVPENFRVKRSFYYKRP